MSSCSIIVEGDYFEKAELEKEIGLDCARYLPKGHIPKYGSQIEKNRWIYSQKFEEITSLEQELSSVVGRLKQSKDYISRLMEENVVELWCSITSDYAQIGFCLSKELLREISSMNLSIYFSVFSWGHISDEAE